MIISEELCFEDLSDIDNDCYKNLRWVQQNDVSNATLYFSVTRENFGSYETIDLKEDGQNIAVTNENKIEYLEKFTFDKMYGSVKAQIDAFIGGIHDVIGKDLIRIFNAKELELLIAGLPNFDGKYFILRSYRFLII